MMLSCAAFAQGSLVRRGIQGASSAGAKASSSALKRTPKLPSVSIPPAAVPAPSLSRPALAPVPSFRVPGGTVSLPELRILQLERSVRNLEAENRQLKITLNGGPLALRRATFQAAETTDAPTNSYSGTVFKTVYNGEEEVFGVVAAHAIASETGELALKRHFTMSVFDGEGFVALPAEIVQLASPNMLDVALVKFSPEAEKLFQPLRISEVPVKFGDVLSSQGFAGDAGVHIPDRQITKVTPLSIRTTIPYARKDRPGLCGSAVVNENQELVGIHTGSVYDREDSRFDVGFATNASFLHTLVEAYHNGGQAAFPLILNKQKIIDLNVDEYISYISFHDAAGKQVWQHGFDKKFSYSKVQEMMDALSPRYITVTTRRTVWNPEEPEVLMRNLAYRDMTKTTYKYDLEARQLISVNKPNEKRGRR